MSSFAVAGEWRSVCPPLSDRVLAAVDRLGFQQMTPVQAQCVPLFAQHKDVVVEAMTGSGKTLAFAVPLLDKLIKGDRLAKNQIGAVVLSPTRELASQIFRVISSLLHEPASDSAEEDDGGNGEQLEYPSCQLVVGGESASVDEDLAAFRQHGANIIVGTPGRLEDFFRRGIGTRSSSTIGMTINIKACEMLILDEADRLLDLGFSSSLDTIIAYLPKQRRTGLFSATMTEGLSQLIRTGLRNPVKIVVKVANSTSGVEWRTPETLDIRWMKIKEEYKAAQLVRSLQASSTGKTIVYFYTCKAAEYFYQLFAAQAKLKKLPVHCVHGQQPMKRRNLAYKAFLEAPSPAILFTTDLAARGLDIADIDRVIQFDPPTDAKMFAHRCGRSARMGQKGSAVVFLTEHEVTFVNLLQGRKVNIREAPVTDPNGLEQEASTLRQQWQALILRDRALMDMSLAAFVSSIRAYRSHELSFIFQIKNVDLLGLLKAYAIVGLPSMPELKASAQLDDIRTYFAGVNVDHSTIAYKDAERERARLLRLSNPRPSHDLERKKAEREAKAKVNAPWSKQKERKERKQARKHKTPASSTPEQAADVESTPPATNVQGPEASAAVDDSDDDWDDVAADMRAAKKARRKPKRRMRFGDLAAGTDEEN
ncbi:ATP-dependent rRNA helicase spb4 [Sorochytrium milnesiophthora]